jgi:predicted DNA-binding transcriptional regulator YafY
MRADRLISLLMLLQTRGRMPARELAGELEVSERTIYRDVEALSAAGVPIYSETGREGGYALLDSYRTSLTGLTDDEVLALFMLSVPEPLEKLGLSAVLKKALLKLAAALPSSRRPVEGSVRLRFHLDSSWWGQAEEPVPHLQTIYQAVRHDRRLLLRYRSISTVQIEKTVDPYGLVAKAGAWYLVSASSGRIHTQRVAELLEARLSDEKFDRPDGFDVGAYWHEWCAAAARQRSSYPVKVRVSPQLVPYLSMYFGESIHTRLKEAGPADKLGWITLDLHFESLEAARDRLLGFGRAAEVLAPGPLRLSLRDHAEQIAALYAELDGELDTRTEEHHFTPPGS